MMEVKNKVIKINVQTSECSCTSCQAACQTRVGWPTPQEAQALIDKGYGPQMMLDWWSGNRYDDPHGDIFMVVPASVGNEGKKCTIGHTTGNWPFSLWAEGWSETCTFYTKDGKCAVHNSGAKPLECRVAHHDSDYDADEVHKAVAMSWNNPEAQELVSKWMREHSSLCVSVEETKE